MDTTIPHDGGHLSRGSGGTADHAAPDLRGRRIGLSYESHTNLFCRDLLEGIREAAAARGATVLAREYENSRERQESHIRDFLAEGVDVLIVSAVDETVAPAIAQARNSGVPVFSVDRAAGDAPVVSHVASDNLLGGRLAADFLADLLAEGGEVAVVAFGAAGAVPGAWAATSIDERIRGFRSALGRHAGLHLVAEVSGGDNRHRAGQATRDLLGAYPRLAAIFATNDVVIQGVIDAVRAAGGEERALVVGYDATPQGCAEIMRGGPLRGEVAQFPLRIGHTVVELWMKHLRGESVPRRLDIPVELVTAANVQRFTGAERLLHVQRGEVWTAGERVVFFPVRGYQMMLNEIHAASPDLLRWIVYRSGSVLGESIAEQVREIYPDPRDRLLVLLADLVRGGYGTFELLDLDVAGGWATVRGHNLFEAGLAPGMVWARTPRSVDTYCSGRLAGYLTSIFGRPATCEEIECEARGDPSCTFAISAQRIEPLP
ncbi:MAG: substrate-binding domain-containing protein [Chloroflexi bacterium]|nr:substrate-binding domain-containing protein [Chloroflexota bacterium]